MDPKFDSFNVTDVTYKTLKNHPFKVAVLVPKNIDKSKPAPVLVKFHGGGMVFGERLYAPWWPPWLLHLATTANAIILSPDYRHIPESTISDILADVQDFFTWLHASFPTALAAIHPHLPTPALDKIAVAGESAGGYITLLAALLLPDPLTRLALAIPQYGALDLTDAVWAAPPDGAPTQPPRTLMGTEPPYPSFVDEHLRAALPHGRVVTERGVEAGWGLSACVTGHAMFGRFAGGDERIKEEALGEMVGKAAGRVGRADGAVVPVWVIQGREDSVVPARFSTGFVEAVRRCYPATPVHYSLEPGEHVFDMEAGVDEEWVQEGLRFAARFWP